MLAGLSERADGAGVFDVRLRVLSTGVETALWSLTVPLQGWSGEECVLLSGPDGQGNRTCTWTTQTGSAETASMYLAYSPLGNEIIAAVTKRRTTFVSVLGFQECPWDVGNPSGELCQDSRYTTTTVGSDIYLVRVPTGQQFGQWALPGKAVFGLALSEDGSQIVDGEGTVNGGFLKHWVNHSYQSVGDPDQFTSCGVGHRTHATGVELRPLIVIAGTTCSDLGRGTVSPAPRRITP